MYPIELQKALNEVAAKYARQFQQSVSNEFNKERLKASGFLASSVKAKWQSATDNSTPQIVIEYEDYGDFIGSRKLIFTKQPPIEKIKEWIEAKGNKFKRKALPGYQSGNDSSISIDKQNTRVAFAIAKKMKFRQRLSRRYKWKKASLPELLKEMNQDLIFSWTNETEKLIANSITGKPINP